jgi:hypothetical protein
MEDGRGGRANPEKKFAAMSIDGLALRSMA